MLRSNSKSLGNHVVSPEEEKEKAVVGKDLQKRKVLVLATLHRESCSTNILQRSMIAFSLLAFPIAAK